jgi:starch synthase
VTEPPVIALVDWSHLLEDFLDPIGVPFEAFCTEMTGGWMFGYLDALRHAGCRPVLFCVSARVTDVTRSEHVPTGATICVLPAPAGYRRVRMRVPNPYAVDLAAAAGDLQGPRRLWTAFLKEVSPYLATPLRTLARELRRERCCVILCQEYEHARFDACVLLGRLAGLPVYATFQGGNWQLSRFERPLRPVALRACAGLIVASSVEAERLRRCYNVPAGKIAPIFNPIDLRLWPPVARHEREEARAALGIPPGARVVAWHGRVEIHRKGLDLLVAAWEAIRRTRAGRLLLVGTGRDAPALRALLANGAGIHWIDEYVTDRALLRRHLAAADVYAFPSRNEGFPMAPVEAMACGLPVVGADAPGVADILGAGPDAAGTVVPVGDAESLAQALGRLLDDEELSVALGARARRRVEERFSRESVGRELRTFLTRGEERR